MANYFVIGGDGKEYGPVSAEDLRKWVGDGRIAAQSKVRPEAAAEWVPLAQVPELAAALKGNPPPALPARTPATAGKTSALAVTSLVLGILGLFTCGFTALFGLILGIMALVKLSNSRGELRGKGLALAGTILSAMFLLMIPVFAALLLPALASAQNKAREINCVNNEKMLALAVRTYSSGNSNQLPPAATWCDAIKANAGSGSIFRCPAVTGEVPGSNLCDYAFNAKLGGMDASKVNPQTVMIFESDGGWDAHGGPELLASPRHRKDIVVAFADGHVEMVPPSRLAALRWDP
jgi:prepilin-type processing-associated H-X9-DG protein